MMSWLKLDDCFPAHPKIVRLSHRAFRLHVSALCYCAQNLTDGVVAKSALPIVGAVAGRSKALTDELEEARLWVPIDEGWTIHGYLDLNPSKHEVEVRRTVAKANAEKRWGANSSANGNANGIADGNAEPNALPFPIPSHPPKSVSSSPNVSSYEGTDAHAFGEPTYERIVRFCLERGYDDVRLKLDRTRKKHGASEHDLERILFAIQQPGTADPLGKALSMLKKRSAA